jgi:hypothetical protein
VLERLDKYEESLYLIFGAVCLTASATTTFGAMFVSIEFAFLNFILVAIPLLVGLLGAQSQLRIFTAIVLISCAIPVVYILRIYLRDAVSHPSGGTSFINERAGWIYLSVYLTEVLFATRRLRQPRAIEMER